MIPEYEAAAFQLTKVGQVSQPVKTQLGYHIIKLEGTKTGTYVPFPEVRDFIRQKLPQMKQAEVLQKYVEDLKKKSKILINEDMLKEETHAGEAPALPGRPSDGACATACTGCRETRATRSADGERPGARKTDAGPKK